ncbi:MAG: glycerophosphodiester phosphodiesterase family protein [Lagierella massiliensis]|nr:glycerophosphodiester phosphodiesterase family protein [Lagierella massiliensis]
MTFVYAHRGSRCNRPENTLISFKEAVKVKADGIELDVRQTKDKKIVVIHDSEISRTTTGNGLVKNLTLQEIKSLDAGVKQFEEFKGEKVPTLKEVLDLLDQEEFTGVLNIEIKSETVFHHGLEKRTANVVLEKPHKFQIVYSSFDIRSLRLIQRYDKDNERYLLLKDEGNSRSKILKVQRDNNLQGIHSTLGKNIRDRDFMKSLKKKTRLWTINKEEDIRYCFENRIDSIITDYPERAIQIRKEYNMKKDKKEN